MSLSKIIQNFPTVMSIGLSYATSKWIHSATLATQKYVAGEISESDILFTRLKYFFKGRMTYLYKNEGQEMAPTIPREHETLLIRSLPCPTPEFRLQHNVRVGDVVLLKNPMDSDKFLVRRLAALGGHEMESTCEKDEPFVIGYDECWVLADNQKLKVSEAKDSRTFGPVPLMDIKGRVIYRFRSMKNHGRVKNSDNVNLEDRIVALFEAEFNEMQKFLED